MTPIAWILLLIVFVGPAWTFYLLRYNNQPQTKTIEFASTLNKQMSEVIGTFATMIDDYRQDHTDIVKAAVGTSEAAPNNGRMRDPDYQPTRGPLDIKV